MVWATVVVTVAVAVVVAVNETMTVSGRTVGFSNAAEQLCSVSCVWRSSADIRCLSVMATNASIDGEMHNKTASMRHRRVDRPPPGDLSRESMIDKLG